MVTPARPVPLVLFSSARLEDQAGRGGVRVQGSVGPGDLARCRGHPPSGAHYLPGRDDARGAQRQRLDDVHLQLERGVGLTAVERRVHGTAHGRVEQRAEDAAVYRPDGVVEVLPDVETEDDLALFDA